MNQDFAGPAEPNAVRVAEFAFDTLLYEGASTLVYGGIRDSDGARVVAKLVRDARRNLTHEYLALQKITGSRVVVALGLYEGSDGPILVEHRFGTGSLADALRGGRFPVRRALRVALQLAQACAQVHAARFVHRDIKPANLLHDAGTDEVVLCDFGTACELPVNARALPVGDLVGTPAYISPEHTGRTRWGCDARSDLYSLGVTLYELLTGVVPFPERDLLEVVAAHLSRAPEPPHRLAEIPPVVSDLVMKLLAKLPDERYQSARGLAADLERCLAELDERSEAMGGGGPTGSAGGAEGKALRGINGDGRIASFELGRSDLLRPRFPQRLFGRADELQVLEQAFTRAGAGAPTLVLISGREGAGRSELVRALLRTVAIGSPLALGGWSAGHERLLSGLSDALGGLAGDLLRFDEDRLAALRHGFAARVGQVGQVIVDAIAPLGDVFGPQPALVELGDAGARARLHHAFRCLASALGDAAPFVLALRNFEHADPASLSLIEAILDNPASCRVLVVVMASDPAAFGALRDRAGAVSIELGALPVDAMTAWAAATLDCELDRARGIGEALHVKSAGNPLLFMRWLEHLIEIGVIERSDGAYAWSVDAVRAAAPPPTLGALASQRITELDRDARRALAATACSEEPVDSLAVAAMLEVDAGTAARHLGALARECLVADTGGSYRAAHPVIVETALTAIPDDEVARMRGRLGAHLLADRAHAPTGPAALRVAMALSRGTVELAAPDRVRAAEHHVVAGEYVMASAAYDVAATLFAGAGALLAALAGDPWADHRNLQFRIELGRARTAMMLGRNGEADALYQALAGRELSPAELGLTYPSWCDNNSMVMNRARAVEVGLEGLERLGIHLPASPPRLRPLAAIRLNQRALGRLTVDYHVNRPELTDPAAKAALQLMGTMVMPALFSGRMGLYVLIAETAIHFILKHGHVRNLSGYLGMHAFFLHTMRGDYAAARGIYEVCKALEQARPAPELVARTYLAFHFLVSPWFGPWQESAAELARAIRLGVEAGDPMYAALCASASITMLFLIGTPLDRIVAAVEGWGPVLRSDGGAAANAANLVNLAGKLTRGEPITGADLDRVSNVPLTAGSMRNNAIVNLGLALSVIGHEAQVRTWLDEIRDRFPQTNIAQPHLTTLWLLDGLFAARDARAGAPERRQHAVRMLESFRVLRVRTLATNCDPAMALLEAELAWTDGEIDRALGLFARATRDARARDLTPLVAYACEERARLLEEAGYPDDATLYYREAVAAYRRWAHVTKVIELELAHPAVRVKDLTSGDDARRAGIAGAGGTVGTGSTGTVAVGNTLGGTVNGPGGGQPINEQMDLVTVLKVSQDVSTQLTGSGVVRAVLTGIAQNAGAERVVFVRRAAGGIDTVFGELQGDVYADIDVPEDRYAALPKSVVRVVRRTGRPLVVADANSDPAYASDPFVIESRCRSIAGIPIRRNAEVMGFVVLENRMVAGAFTPQLVSLAQALVAQAAISLDNAILYDSLSALNLELEARVEDRTRALRKAQQQLIESARKAGMADVAVEVLHNVGNALNSVNVSAQMIHSQLASSKTATLVRVTALLHDHRDNLAGFFASDPRSTTVAQMLTMLGGALTGEQEALAGELRRLRINVDNIVAVVQELNTTAEDKGSAILEAPHVLVGDVAAAATERAAREHIAISIHCPELPGARVDKHKAFDILTGLLANALDAVTGAAVEPRQIRVTLREIPDAVVVQVSDNGVGIRSEDITRIFRGGFSSKPDRRGANLHRFANSATLAGGSLTAESEGVGRGATFTLVLPNRARRTGRIETVGPVAARAELS